MNIAFSSTTVITALLGAGVGLGLLLIVISWRGGNPPRPRRSLPLLRLGDGPHRRRLMIRLGVASAIGVLAGVATGWWVGAVLAGMACWSLPRVLGGDPEHAQRISRIEAVATWTEMLRDTLSAASGLEQAILATAPLAPAPIRSNITDLAARLETGERLAPSLRRLADELADPTGDLVIAALAKASEQQSRRLGDLLGALAHTAREQVSMRLRVEASRARTRTSVRVIVGTTLVFAVAMVLLNRGYLSAYDSAAGQAVLLGVGLLFALGFGWLTRISRIAEPARLLSVTDTPSSEDARLAISERV